VTPTRRPPAGSQAELGRQLCSTGPQIIASLGSPAAGSREQGVGSRQLANFNASGQNGQPENRELRTKTPGPSPKPKPKQAQWPGRVMEWNLV